MTLCWAIPTTGMADALNRRKEGGLATRRRLIEVATALFAANGYEASLVEAVLQEAG